MGSYRNSKLGRFVLIGSILGAVISLFDRGTRQCLRDNMRTARDNSIKLFKTARQNPQQITDYFERTASNLRMTAQEVSQDIEEFANKVKNAKDSSTQAYHYAVEAGDEISQIAHKIRNTRENVMMIDSSPASVLPASTQTTGSQQTNMYLNDANHQNKSGANQTSQTSKMNKNK
ncbi:methyl-accepting chemotaxis protein [Scopulibacillus daqui]|uniref:Methyl-accepting chemotaxis protein n=1 Tax=Scopulibacillus daqui TaxID=1469162 RepID=A0ABS2PZN9_9BACL|nr:YtxH domain-containing protein [Scopulibacillus daqui]MBM7645190.1 methyl-accepting chemotaxis protein [Scopulibacillus daqui]